MWEFRVAKRLFEETGEKESWKVQLRGLLHPSSDAKDVIIRTFTVSAFVDSGD
jgi:hypothetical protein